MSLINAIYELFGEHYLLVVTLTLLFYYLSSIERRNVPPGPRGLPVLGYIPFLGDAPKTLAKLAERYGNIINIRCGPNNVIIRYEALSSDAFTDRPTPNLFSVMNPDEFTNWNGQLWKEHRRFALKALRTLGLGKPAMESLIEEEIRYLLDQLEKSIESNTLLPLRNYLAPSTSNVVAAAITGKRYDYDHPTRKLLDMVFNPPHDDMQVPLTGFVANNIKYLCYLIDHLPFSLVRILRQTINSFNAYMEKEVADHVTTFDKSNVNDFIDLYIEECNSKQSSGLDTTMSLDRLQGMAQSMFVAGSNTVKDSIEWILVMVAAHNDVQVRIHQEIDRVIGSDRFPTYSDRTDMIYTQAVILETLRFSSLLPINLPHVCSKDTDFVGYLIPKGYHVLVNLWAIHNDTNYWSEPEKFMPERFISDDGTKLVKHESFAPFSVGKRSCPGEALAQVELFLYITAILQKFTVEGQPGHKLSTKPRMSAFSYIPQKVVLMLKIRQ